MSTRTVLPWLLAVALVTLLLVMSFADRTSSPTPTPAGARIAAISLARPHWAADRVTASMVASDRVRADLLARGVADPSAFIVQRLRELPVSESEARAFHGANPQIFGRRSFEASSAQAEELVRIQKLRDELALPTPDNGVLYPGF